VLQISRGHTSIEIVERFRPGGASDSGRSACPPVVEM
jgi:hypothetical protein